MPKILHVCDLCNTVSLREKQDEAEWLSRYICEVIVRDDSNPGFPYSVCKGQVKPLDMKISMEIE